MRCLSCNKNLSDKEASRKFLGWKEIANPEDRYIGLCDDDLRETGLACEEDPAASDKEFQDETEVDEDASEGDDVR